MDPLKQKRLERLKGTVVDESPPHPKLDAAYKHYCSEMEYWGWPIMSREEWDDYPPKPANKKVRRIE